MNVKNCINCTSCTISTNKNRIPPAEKYKGEIDIKIIIAWSGDFVGIMFWLDSSFITPSISSSCLIPSVDLFSSNILLATWLGKELQSTKKDTENPRQDNKIMQGILGKDSAPVLLIPCWYFADIGKQVVYWYFYLLARIFDLQRTFYEPLPYIYIFWSCTMALRRVNLLPLLLPIAWHWFSADSLLYAW